MIFIKFTFISQLQVLIILNLIQVSAKTIYLQDFMDISDILGELHKKLTLSLSMIQHSTFAAADFEL